MEGDSVRSGLLIVDDNVSWLQLMATVLGRGVCSPDLRGALRIAAVMQPRLVLLDHYLRGRLTGIDAIPDFRRVAPSCRVIILTIDPDQADRKAARTAGASGYMAKDDLDRLRAVVDAALAEEPTASSVVVPVAVVR